jgi:muramoyltetrapeptide carboxypeptidase
MHRLNINILKVISKNLIHFKISRMSFLRMQESHRKTSIALGDTCIRRYDSKVLRNCLILLLFLLINLDLFSEEIIKAQALKKGDTVGLIAPATNVADPADIQKAKEITELLGLEIKLGKNVMSGSGYKTRTRQERADDLNSMFADTNIKAIFCLRGGYGSASILDLIDYENIKANPKLFCGFSDITALHTAINKYSGLITLHSPVMLSPFGGNTLENFRKVLFGENVSIIQNPKVESGSREKYPILTINSGKAKGELVGGNLTLICSLLGTDYEIDTKNKILFFEDTGEAPYKIHRMLTGLRLSGKFEGVKGVIIGACNDCKSSGSPIWDGTQTEIYYEFFSQYEFPVFYGLMAGHSGEQLTLPLGINIEMNSTTGIIKLLEKATE